MHLIISFCQKIANSKLKNIDLFFNQQKPHEPCLLEGGGGTTSGGGGGGEYDYADVLGKSILFYEAQRSGFYEVNI